MLFVSHPILIITLFSEYKSEFHIIGEESEKRRGTECEHVEH